MCLTFSAKTRVLLYTIEQEGKMKLLCCQTPWSASVTLGCDTCKSKPASQKHFWMLKGISSWIQISEKSNWVCEGYLEVKRMYKMFMKPHGHFTKPYKELALYVREGYPERETIFLAVWVWVIWAYAVLNNIFVSLLLGWLWVVMRFSFVTQSRISTVT